MLIMKNLVPIKEHFLHINNDKMVEILENKCRPLFSKFNDSLNLNVGKFNVYYDRKTKDYTIEYENFIEFPNGFPCHFNLQCNSTNFYIVLKYDYSHKEIRFKFDYDVEISDLKKFYSSIFELFGDSKYFKIEVE